MAYRRVRGADGSAAASPAAGHAGMGGVFTRSEAGWRALGVRSAFMWDVTQAAKCYDLWSANYSLGASMVDVTGAARVARLKAHRLWRAAGPRLLWDNNSLSVLERELLARHPRFHAGGTGRWNSKAPDWLAGPAPWPNSGAR